MNRESSAGQGSRQTSSSNYLVYLFLLSAAFIVVVPYMGVLVKPGKKSVEMPEKVNVDRYNKKVYAPALSSSYPAFPSSDYLMTRSYSSEGKCDALEVVVLDLQKVVQIEREKTLHLENEIRILQISENFLKERIQYLEDKRGEPRKDMGSNYATSLEIFLQNSHLSDGKVDTIIHELLKMVQIEKERTSSFEVEIRILQKSETVLIERIEKLESQFASICRQSDVCDSK